MDLSQQIANMVIEKLKTLRMQRKELAALTGVSPSEVTRWLSGTHNFELKTIAKIEQALRIEIITVTGKENTKFGNCYPYTISINGKLVFENFKK